MRDYVELEMKMAEIMAEQERSGFRFDMERAVEVKAELQQEYDDLEQQILVRFPYVPGKDN